MFPCMTHVALENVRHSKMKGRNALMEDLLSFPCDIGFTRSTLKATVDLSNQSSCRIYPVILLVGHIPGAFTMVYMAI